jgi:prephenate dehydrogenase
MNLPSAVRDADLVLLALPMDQIRETIAVIAPDLKEGVVVMDTGPVKDVVAAWAGELLPAGRHYVGLTPVINPAYLNLDSAGLEAARADLFHDGMMGIVAPPRTPSEAIKLAADLAQLLGSIPMFADTIEIDSLMAATHTLPQLLGAILLNLTVDRPGWREARKVAGRAYAQVTAPASQMDEPAALQDSAVLNRENVLRVLDGAIAELEALRSEIAREDTLSIQTRLEQARRGHEVWLQQRKQANWAAEETGSSVEPPTTQDVLGRFLGLGRKPKGKK